MDVSGNDWSNLSLGDVFQKDDNSKPDQIFPGSQEEDDLTSSLAIYDGYDSYNESLASSDNDLDTIFDTANDFLDNEENVSKYRFLNNKDGMATCENCGSIGVKHAFYSKSKRFCSLSCSKSYSISQKEIKPFKPTPPAAAKKGKPATKKVTPKSQAALFKTSGRGELGRSFDWGPYLMNSQSSAASVSCFKHVPMADCWDQMVEGVLVEVPNLDLDVKEVQVYWIATVLKICGYKALLRYEGFGSDSSKDFWGNLLSEDIHNVGWCATYGKMLSPPKTIKDKYPDWREFLIKRLTGTRTIPPHFYTKSQDWLSDHKVKVGMKLEVVNKMCVSAMRVAFIREVIGGRLRLNYADTGEDIDEFWCHMTSPLIHFVGWSQMVGHKLHASQAYINSCVNKVTANQFDPNDVTAEMFAKVKDPPHGLSFQVGMKLEAIDPLNLSAICVATVTKVLRNDYLMIGIDGSMAENGSDWFCYHTTSPCIFPVGFCEINNLTLTPPRNNSDDGRVPFRWFDYLKETRSMAAPVKLFDKDIPKHGFRVGMKVEAVDLMEPRLICVATVTKVVGRLLRIHFDGWEDNYDQWIDCQSPDIYPVGWCEVMRHGLEGPRSRVDGVQMLTNGPVVSARKRKGKGQMHRAPRKKRVSSSDRRSREIPRSTTPVVTPVGTKFSTSVNSQDVAKQETVVSPNQSVVPPHRMLSPEAVAATLPPLLEPDEKPTTVKTEVTSPTPAKEGNPPVLSPHAKMPKGFSQELADRLTSTSTPSEKTLKSEIAEKKESTQAASSSSITESSDSSSGIVLTLSSRLRELPLKKWSLSDVVGVLKVNGCGLYSNMFIKKNMDGQSLISLSSDQLKTMMSMLNGPIDRLADLILQVKNCAGV